MPWTPLGELTAPPDILVGFGGEIEKRKGRKMERGKGKDQRGRKGKGGEERIKG